MHALDGVQAGQQVAQVRVRLEHGRRMLPKAVRARRLAGLAPHPQLLRLKRVITGPTRA